MKLNKLLGVVTIYSPFGGISEYPHIEMQHMLSTFTNHSLSKEVMLTATGHTSLKNSMRAETLRLVDFRKVKWYRAA